MLRVRVRVRGSCRHVETCFYSSKALMRLHVAELSLVNLPVGDETLEDLLLTMGSSLRQLEWVPCPAAPPGEAGPKLMCEDRLGVILSSCALLTSLYIEDGAADDPGSISAAGVSGDRLALLVARARLPLLGACVVDALDRTRPRANTNADSAHSQWTRGIPPGGRGEKRPCCPRRAAPDYADSELVRRVTCRWSHRG